MVDDLADRLGAPRAEVFVSARDRPFAIAAGFTRPTLLVSQWMLSQLDSGELASVVAHEIAHVARRDYLVGWLATLLRDAFYYLPTSRTAHRQLQREKEIACDELAASLTKRPLALASALAKVWQQGAQGAAFAGAQGLASPGSNALIEGRIIRLLASPIPEPRLENSIRPLLLSAATILGLVLAEGVSVAAFLATMGCASGWPVAAVL